MSMKRRTTMDDLEELTLGIDFSQQPVETEVLCNDLSPDVLNGAFADGEDLLPSSTNLRTIASSQGKYNSSLAHRQPSVNGAWLGNEELSFQVNGAANAMVTRSASRVTREPRRPAARGTVPSALASPASSSSSAVRRTHHESSCSSETSAPTVRGGKRRRGSSRQNGTEKTTDEYRRRRVRNNMAVRKSRDKAKQRQEETTQKVSDLAVENESLNRQLDSVRQELSLLRSIFSNLGVPIQQLVTDALQSSTPGVSQHAE